MKEPAVQDLYTVPELAQKWRVSKAYLYEQIRLGNLPAVKLPTIRGERSSRLRVTAEAAARFGALFEAA